MNVSLSKAWNWWTPNAQLWIYLCIFRSWSELRSYMLHHASVNFVCIAAFVVSSSFLAKQQHYFPPCSVFAAGIFSWTWWKFLLCRNFFPTHQSRVPIAELLRSRKKKVLFCVVSTVFHTLVVGKRLGLLTFARLFPVGFREAASRWWKTCPSDVQPLWRICCSKLSIGLHPGWGVSMKN